MSEQGRWALACRVAELQASGAMSFAAERVRLAVFWHEGQPFAIANVCNHKGGPLVSGQRNGEFVKCPWHGWEYSVVTGFGPPGYEAESVASYPVEVRGEEIWVGLEPRSPRRLLKHAPHSLARPVDRSRHDRVRVLGISTTAMDPTNPRYSTSEALLEHALDHAGRGEGDLTAETRLIRLRDLAFRPCEGNYSKAARACTWPCAITERDPEDQLTPVYEGVVHWADVVLVATPIRWGAPSSLYSKMVERMNCIQNQITLSGRSLIQRKVAAFIITGGQDNVQAVAGQMLAFFSELGFQFPPFPFIAHSRGWTAEDMERNVIAVQGSESLRSGARELVMRAVETARHLHDTGHFAKAGRKAAPVFDDASRPGDA